MLLRPIARRLAWHVPSPFRARFVSSVSTPTPQYRPTHGFLNLGGLAALGLVSTAVFGAVIFTADARSGAQELQELAQKNGNVTARTRPPTPLSTLIRTYVVYSFCSIPGLVDWSPKILNTLLAVPGLRGVTEAVVRETFFSHFVGGETAEDAFPLIDELRAQNTGCLFAYSVEVDEAAASGQGQGASALSVASVHKQIVNETLHCVDVAANYEDGHSAGPLGRRTWVAIKLSAMVQDAETLRRFSTYLVENRPRVDAEIAFPGCPLPSDLDVLASSFSSSLAAGPLTESDLVALRELREDLAAVCTRAQQRAVRVIFDAEYSWYEPAIDAFTLDMMRRFNKLPSPHKCSWLAFHNADNKSKKSAVTVQPLVYATYQAYLRRTPEYLAQSIAAARKEGYSLGVKLVRGAYHPHEVVAHQSAAAAAGQDSPSISPDLVPPVWLEKAETDARYNACVRTLVEAVRADVEHAQDGEGGERTPRLGVLFGTHNWESAKLIVDELVRLGLGVVGGQGQDQGHRQDGVVVVGDAVAERVTIGQLYGMTAALTNCLVDRIRSSSPFVIKYIPYGRLSEVMPYLSRRAIENKSVLGNGTAQEERRRAAAEIVARVFG